MVVGEGEWALPGTLTLPKGEGRFPLVILVHGSGPNDRDETVGGAKPFRDLAAGLAGKGVAVLRYDKVTAEHSLKVSALPRFSLEDETVADALRAVELAKTLKEIDPDNIFVAGHSQGGYAMPLILGQAQGASIKGAVLLSAPSGNISEVLVEQQDAALQRLKETGQPEALIAQQQVAVAAYKSMVETIHDPAYSADRLPEHFLLGDPYWWIQQRDYQPAEQARTQTAPLFIAQGENDWQVSMKQFEGWKAALKDRANVTFASYPSVNHLLTQYGSLSTGLEYTQPSNVASAIVEDVAQWVKAQAGH
ncbi:Alpha/beta hydrolase family protein [compost metagenome]